MNVTSVRIRFESKIPGGAQYSSLTFEGEMTAMPRPILTIADVVEARDRLLRLGFTLADTPTGETRYISVEDGRWLLGLADFLTDIMPQIDHATGGLK